MKARWILALVLCALSVPSASAIPISYISATTVPTQFDPDAGAYGIGLLELEGTLSLIVHYKDGTQEALANTRFYLSADLFRDSSSGGQARGEFIGGTIRILDSANDLLLSGNVSALHMNEIFNDIGMLAATGSFTADDGALLAALGYPTGSISEIAFDVHPKALDNLKVSFDGRSNITLAPIPEPTTLFLLALASGALAARGRRIRR